MNSEEHEIQKAICEYLDMRNICYWAVPNGGLRSKAEAGRLKKEGVKSGVPDLCLIYDGLYFGLEVKKPMTNTRKGYLSKNQKAMHDKIEDAGGTVKTVYSVADVILWVNTWGMLRV